MRGPGGADRVGPPTGWRRLRLLRHAVEGRGLPIDGAGGRSGGTPGELVLADLVRGERGGPRGAAEERGEMGGAAAGGAVGPELPDLVVMEVGVAEVPQGRPLGAERARARCRRAGGTGGGGRAGLVRGHGLGPSLVAATGRRRPSTFALVGATGKWHLRRRRHGESTCSAVAGGRVAGPVREDRMRGPCSTTDRERLWSTKLGHPVEHVARKHRFDISAAFVLSAPPGRHADGNALHLYGSSHITLYLSRVMPS